jgi:mRNA interferase RelE/StbE
VSYRILFTPRAERDLSALPERDRARLARRIDGLATDPRPSSAKKLSGAEDLYRLRSGDYRVIYLIENRIVTVTIVRVGHRRDIYR